MTQITSNNWKEVLGVDSPDQINWTCISTYQSLSEEFIREFRDKVDWVYISMSQSLSEDFIREFRDKVNWTCISMCQSLSEDLMKEFLSPDQIQFHHTIHDDPGEESRIISAKEYIKKYSLESTDEGFYAWRKHTLNKKGYVNGGPYEEGVYYRDWHLDYRTDKENSFGLGIWPREEKNNVRVFVRWEDFGVEVDREDGKARVWGFRVEK